MEPLLILTIVAVGVIVLFDYTNGFHDASNIVATVIASRAMSPLRAIVLVAFFKFLGPLVGGTAVAIVGYAKTTVREMEILEVAADQSMRQMSELLREGVECLQHGYQLLASHPAEAEQDAQCDHKTERAIERVYRQAVADLFDEKQITKMVTDEKSEGVAEALSHIVRMLRRRELYRHLSNAGDKVEIAAEVLHDIIVKLI